MQKVTDEGAFEYFLTVAARYAAALGVWQRHEAGHVAQHPSGALALALRVEVLCDLQCDLAAAQTGRQHEG